MQRGVLDALWFTADFDGDECDYEFGAGIGDGEEFGTNGGNFYGQLLCQFTSSSISVGFTRLALPAGEFPEIAVALVGRTAADEVVLITLYDRSYYANGSRWHY